MERLIKFLKSYLGYEPELREWKTERGLLKLVLHTEQDGDFKMNVCQFGSAYRVCSVTF